MRFRHIALKWIHIINSNTIINYNDIYQSYMEHKIIKLELYESLEVTL